MLYKRICSGVNDRGILIPENETIWDYIDYVGSDYYESLYLYTEEQYKEFETKHTVSGINDLVTNCLLFDFDSKDNLEAARNDALILVESNPDLNFEIAFSGQKGFTLKVYLDEYISVEQFKNAVFNLAGHLETFDKVVNNPSRIIRVIGTKHKKSGLYKVQLTQEELQDLSIGEILELARNANETFSTEISKLPERLRLRKKITSSSKNDDFDNEQLDYSIKPKFLSNCRWALQNGYFKDGQRSTALLCLAATYKNVPFSEEIVYRMLKGVAEIQAQREGTDRFPDNEIYNNIILQVFSDTWKNGQYSCREPGNFLYDYCRSLGVHKCDHVHDDQMKPRTLSDLSTGFKDFVKHIEENTITTGIKAIDENFFLSTGSNVGILGAPGSGKSALGLEILENTSKQGVRSIFASLDMHRNRMFEKVMYRISGLPREDLFHKFQMDQESELMDKLKEKYGNVFFMHKSCPTVQDVRDYVLACQEACGEKIKLVMIDYFERISSDMSDDTASSKRVAGELQDLVNDLDVCLITLVQPNKVTGDSSEPIYSYTSIKGSSFVSQAFRQILSIWRPFSTPELKENDKFLQLAILKNDLGEIGEFVFGWNGKRGQIKELEDHQFNEFEQLLSMKERIKSESDDF